ncbi:phosphatase PAP2 family protein [Sulfurimonas sp.]|uniref:phosphatase PAP2 family protein n=1 Tax=Sulfurimonas sp. TaxID=2022749 RepID=UPI0025F00FD8|nr:phosphatase PAP2 family protein [Sulfurimonas sp.]
MIFSKKAYTIYILTLTILAFVSYFTLDVRIAKYFLNDVKTYEPIGDLISVFGESHWYIGTAILGFLFFKYYKKNELYKQRFLFLLYINLFSGIISLFLKWIFGRIRPWGMRNGNDDYGFLLFQNFDMGFVEKMKYHFITLSDAPTTFTSFPSGHTTTVFAFFTFMSLFFPRYIFIWFVGAIILVSSRILANDHFLSDIFAGIMVGTISTIFLYSKLRGKIEKVS